MKLKIPNWGSLCNPNLLTNSDFKNGIVNQKGQTGYTVLDQYSIDMWQIVDQGSLTVQEKTITTSANMNQYIDGRLENGSYCTTINVNGIVHSSVFNDFQGDYMDINVGPCRASLYYDSARNKTLFKFYPNSDKIIHFMKLEPGEHFTGMPPWNRVSELEKCKERFLFVPTVFNGYVDENGKIFISCEDSRKLVKQPSLIIDPNTQLVLYYDDGNGTYLLENIKEGRYATKDGYICLGTLTSYKNWRISGYYKSGKIFLDSYD